MNQSTTIDTANSIPATGINTAGMTATYSPEDNKLRLYSLRRLDTETYNRVKEAGFSWAPKQDLFVAPAWSPSRESLLLELCGEIGDEDTTLVDRAEQRAGRFADYHTSRTGDAESAYQKSQEIGGRFEAGQPILVGHHSEKRARKDKERMDQSMRTAVTMWERAEYWSHRAKAALSHAKYKERPDVRARRIKKLEAEARKFQREIAQAEMFTTQWRMEGLTVERAKEIAGYDYITCRFPLADYPRELPASQSEERMSLWSALGDGIIDAAQARTLAINAYKKTALHYGRWLSHTQNRLAYERAMLGEAPGSQHDYQLGGRVLVRGEWLTIVRINKKEGVVCSLTTNCRYVPVKSIEEVRDYEAPTAEAAATAKAAKKVPPLCNYPGEGIVEITQKQWDDQHKDYKGTREMGVGAQAARGARVQACKGDDCERHRVRIMLVKGGYSVVYIADRKRVDPKPLEADADPLQPIAAPERATEEVGPQQTTSSTSRTTEAAKFDDLRAILRNGGAQVVSAPQLFPTPAHLADRMVDLAQLEAGESILEPHGGTGRICAAIARAVDVNTIQLTIGEIQQQLSGMLRNAYPDAQHVCADFLEWNKTLEMKFDCVLMNPPFAGAVDIEHVRHGLRMLKPGGRLVAISANGPRQNDQLKSLAIESGGSWEVLPADSFKESGTGVNTVLLQILA